MNKKILAGLGVLGGAAILFVVLRSRYASAVEVPPEMTEPEAPLRVTTITPNSQLRVQQIVATADRTRQQTGPLTINDSAAGQVKANAFANRLAARGINTI